MMNNGPARHTPSLGTTGSRTESGALSARLRAWLPVRRLFVGDVVS